MDVAYQTTVCVEPTVHTDVELGAVTGGATTSRSWSRRYRGKAGAETNHDRQRKLKKKNMVVVVGGVPLRNQGRREWRGNPGDGRQEKYVRILRFIVELTSADHVTYIIDLIVTISYLDGNKFGVAEPSPCEC
jgi:hypothetical protein